jgi:hypothetical protein
MDSRAMAVERLGFYPRRGVGLVEAVVSHVSSMIWLNIFYSHFICMNFSCTQLDNKGVVSFLLPGGERKCHGPADLKKWVTDLTDLPAKADNVC